MRVVCGDADVHRNAGLLRVLREMVYLANRVANHFDVDLYGTDRLAGSERRLPDTALGDVIQLCDFKHMDT